MDFLEKNYYLEFIFFMKNSAPTKETKLHKRSF